MTARVECSNHLFMRNRGSAVLGIILIVVGFLLFPLLLTSFDDMNTARVTSIGTVITGGGETAGNMTLTSGLYDDNTDNVVNITSSSTADAPAPASYSHATKALAVSGLHESDTRAITVDYKTERQDNYLSTIIPFAPFLIFIFFLAGGGGLIYHSFR